VAQDEYIYEFGRFQLNPSEHLLLCDNEPVPVTAKAFQTLLVLVRNCGHLVDKSELVNVVWGETFVEEGNLAVTISILRKVLGDDRNAHKYIETVSKQGYRFLPVVNKVRAAPPPTDSLPVDEEIPNDLPSFPKDVSAPDAVIASARTQSKGYVWLVASLAAIGIISIVALYILSSIRSSRNLGRTIHSIAVLPFEMQGSDAASSHIGMGIADDLIRRLGGTDHIEVRPADAVVKYASVKIDAAAIAQEQKVDALLTGTINNSDGKIHITARLLSSNGKTLWHGDFEKPFAQMADLEDQIEVQVVRTLYPDRKPLIQPKQVSRDPAAYQLYTEGRYFWNKRTETGFRHSIECFQQALLRDPGYADAYAGLADSYTLLASYGVEPTQEAYPNAKAAALRALQLDDSLAEAHTSLGMVALYYEWDWPKADREFRRAIELNPNYAQAHIWDALYFVAMGQPDQALQQALRAQELDPVSLMAHVELGRVYYRNRQYDKAVASLKHALELDPYFARAHTSLGMVWTAQKNYPEAIRESQEASRLSDPDPYLDGLTGYAEAMGGNTKTARRMLSDLIERSRHQYVPAFSVALVYIGLGDRNQAMDWLEKAYQDRSTYMVYSKVDPLLDPVRSDPRFVALMFRMALQDGRSTHIPPKKP